MQRSKRIQIFISLWVYIVIAMACFIIPWRWVLAWIVASLIHESFHLAAIKICNGSVWQIHFMITGAVIQTDLLLPWQEAVCAMAGPLGSAMLIFLIRYFPETAICGCLQCAYNLLPVYPNDGGRFIKAILECIITQAAAFKTILVINHAVILLLLLCGLYMGIHYSIGPMPVLAAIILWWKTKKSLH